MGLTRASVEQAFGEAVLHYAKKDRPLTPDMRFKDAGFDSLSIVEVVMMTEVILGIEIDDDISGGWHMGTTIQEAVDAITAKVPD